MRRILKFLKSGVPGLQLYFVRATISKFWSKHFYSKML